MTFWYTHDMGGWGWFGMSVGMVLFWALIVTVLVLVVRSVDHPRERTRTPAAPTPEQILGERYARGEIDEEEYRRRLSTLRNGPPPRS
ncbi:SHOCT domain-containing protein [Streptomyces sp. NPDC004783]|uniref:SHOCT domain-containing protein n=1 Tax=Streptomyces sp. NPDC004783 TaxID=3154459 RepID=UPI0033B9C6CF